MRKLWFSFGSGLSMLILYCIFTGSNPFDPNVWFGISPADVSFLKNPNAAADAEMASLNAMVNSAWSGN